MTDVGGNAFQHARLEHAGFGVEIDNISYRDGGIVVSVNEYFPSFKFNSRSRYWNGNPYNSDAGNRNPPERTYVILNRAR